MTNGISETDLAAIEARFDQLRASLPSDPDRWQYRRFTLDRLLDDFPVLIAEVRRLRSELTDDEWNDRAALPYIVSDRDEARAEVAALRERVADLEATFDLRHRADMRAIERWRAGHPERALTLPDQADLCVWLLERLEESSAQLAEGQKTWYEREDLLLSALRSERAQLAEATARVVVLEAIRPEVLAFAVAMEQQLRNNDHKGGWKDDSEQSLFRHLSEEVTELRACLPRQKVPKDHLLSEAADVGNMAMMVADVCGALPTVANPNPLAAAVGHLVKAAVRWRDDTAPTRSFVEAVNELSAAVDALRALATWWPS